MPLSGTQLNRALRDSDLSHNIGEGTIDVRVTQVWHRFNGETPTRVCTPPGSKCLAHAEKDYAIDGERRHHWTAYNKYKESWNQRLRSFLQRRFFESIKATLPKSLKKTLNV